MRQLKKPTEQLQTGLFRLVRERTESRYVRSRTNTNANQSFSSSELLALGSSGNAGCLSAGQPVPRTSVSRIPGPQTTLEPGGEILSHSVSSPSAEVSRKHPTPSLSSSGLLQAIQRICLGPNRFSCKPEEIHASGSQTPRTLFLRHHQSCTSTCHSDQHPSSISTAQGHPSLAQTLRPFFKYSTAADGGTAGAEYFVHGTPSTMRAAVLWEPKAEMQVEQLFIPKPQAEEVLVQTSACGVCHTDLHVILSEVPFPMPCVLGHEISGVVADHGRNTSEATKRRLPVGTRVVGAFIMPCGGCHLCTQGKEDLCETFFHFNRGQGVLYDGQTRLFRASDGRPLHMYSMGGLADFCCLPATALAPLPSSLPLPQSAVLGCALFTAYGALRNAADLRAAQSLAVIGAGGVGSSCIQVARAFGASIIIGVDVAADKLQKCVDLGATATIDATGLDKFEVAAKIKELTGGRGVDVAVEALGRSSTFESAVLSVKDGGKAVMVGIAPVGVSASVNITHVVRRNISIIGSYGARARVDLPALIQLAERGQLDVSGAVNSRHDLEEAGAVYADLSKGKVLGRAIIDMSHGQQ